MTFYKASHPDGRDFYSGTVDYAAAVGGEPLTTDLDDGREFPGPGWLHLATEATACVGMRWPCRLFEVEPVGEVRRDDAHPHKVGCRSVRVVREVDAHLALGPQGRQIAALIDRASRLTGDELERLVAALDAAWDAALDAARDAARDAAWAAAWAAAWDAARDAARDAALALVVADLIGQHGLTQQHVDTLLAPWRDVIGDPLAEPAAVVS